MDDASFCDHDRASIVYSMRHHCPVTVVGPSAAGVPGEVSGFRLAWKKYGRLPWKDLVQPAINLAKRGFRFGYAAYAAASGSSLSWIRKDAGLRYTDKKGLFMSLL